MSTIPDPSTPSSPSNQPSTSYTDSYAVDYLVAAFTAVAWYNALELLILIFVTFKRFRGLYFWSLFVSTALGVIPYALGFLMMHFRLIDSFDVSLAIITAGWYCMVTGQSVVLYSRLHLVLHDKNVLNRILYMICINAVLFHIPTTVLSYGARGPPNEDRKSASPWSFGYSVMEKIQMTAFCIQEFIISVVYVRETLKVLKTTFNGERRPRRIMWQLIWINVFIIIIDLALLGIEYANLYTLETTFKGMVYSIKLRLEFAVLSQLVSISTATRDASNAGTMLGGFDLNGLDFGTGTELPLTQKHGQAWIANDFGVHKAGESPLSDASSMPEKPPSARIRATNASDTQDFAMPSGVPQAKTASLKPTPSASASDISAASFPSKPKKSKTSNIFRDRDDSRSHFALIREDGIRGYDPEKPIADPDSDSDEAGDAEDRKNKLAVEVEAELKLEMDMASKRDSWVQDAAYRDIG